jgi:hypothetical protein
LIAVLTIPAPDTNEIVLAASATRATALQQAMRDAYFDVHPRERLKKKLGLEMQDAENTGVFNILQNPELPRRHPTKALSLLRRGGPGKGIDADTAGHAKADVLGQEVLPPVTLTERRAKFVVAHPAGT